MTTAEHERAMQNPLIATLVKHGWTVPYGSVVEGSFYLVPSDGSDDVVLLVHPYRERDRLTIAGVKSWAPVEVLVDS